MYDKIDESILERCCNLLDKAKSKYKADGIGIEKSECIEIGKVSATEMIELIGKLSVTLGK